MSVDILGALGAGSGLNVKNLVSQLVDAEKVPQQALLDGRTTRLQAKVSAMSTFRSSLDALVGALDKRITAGSLSGIPGVSDPGALGLKVTGGTLVPRQSIEILQLARAQTLSSATIAPDAAFGEGTLTIRFGTVAGTDAATGFDAGALADLSVTIGPDDTSLVAVRDAINNAAVGAGAPVQASIIADADGSRLVIRGQSGAESGFVVETAGDPALEQFAFNPDTAAGMTRNQSAADSEIRVEGVTVRRPTNSVTDVIEGATLSLYRASPGTSIVIEAQRDTEDMADTVSTLASALNELLGIGKNLSAAATDTSSAGALVSDSATRRTLSSLSQLGSTPLVAADGNAPTMLAEIGLTMSRSGTFSVDTAKLAKAIASFPDAIEAMVTELVRPATATDAGGPLTRIAATFAVSLDGANGQKTALQAEQDSIATAQGKLDRYIESYQARLTTQFSALDTSVNRYKSIQTFLDQQIALWTKSRD